MLAGSAVRAQTAHFLCQKQGRQALAAGQVPVFSDHTEEQASVCKDGENRPFIGVLTHPQEGGSSPPRSQGLEKLVLSL